MAGLLSSVSSVGAGVSQGRTQGTPPSVRLKDQEQLSGGVKAAALQLIQSAVAATGTARHDLDVLA